MGSTLWTGTGSLNQHHHSKAVSISFWTIPVSSSTSAPRQVWKTTWFGYRRWSNRSSWRGNLNWNRPRSGERSWRALIRAMNSPLCTNSSGEFARLQGIEWKSGMMNCTLELELPPHLSERARWRKTGNSQSGELSLIHI